MTIQVKTSYEYYEPVTVQILDEAGDLLECDHAGAQEEMLDYGYASYAIQDWVDDERNTLVCDKPNCDFQEIIEPEEPDYDREDY